MESESLPKRSVPALAQAYWLCQHCNYILLLCDTCITVQKHGNIRQELSLLPLCVINIRADLRDIDA